MSNVSDIECLGYDIERPKGESEHDNNIVSDKQADYRDEHPAKSHIEGS